MQDDVHYLYKITNLVNGKLYIGVTTNPTNRKAQHFTKVKKGRPVNKAVKKYGKENFTFEVLCIGTRDYIYALEQKAISSYDSLVTGHGYNLSVGGMGGKGGLRGPVKSRSDDKEIYVSGWWFPNLRTALSKLQWGQGLFNSRKKRNLLGEIKIPEKKSGPQKFVYALGFWFPSKKYALAALDISQNVYEKRRVEGYLGDIKVPQRKSNSTALKVPNYYKGFWFPDLFIAGQVYNKRPESIRQQILRGVFEENNKIKKEKPSRNYMAEGKEFSSLEEASLALGIPLNTIKNRISKKIPTYGYIYSTQG